MNTRRVLAFSLASLALACVSVGARAQAGYPSKNIEVVVPFAPGGGTDNLMRTITAIMDENKWSPVALNVNNRVKQVEPRLPLEARRQGVVVEKGSQSFLQVIAVYSPDQRYD